VRPARLRAVLLDAYGTLVELQPPAPLLRAELASRHKIDVTEAEAAAAIAAEIAHYRRHHHRAFDQPTLQALRAECAEVLRAALPAGVAINASLTDALLASLRFVPFDDARPALTALHQRGLRLVVVSDWDVSLHAVLEQTGLAPLLDGVITSAEAGAAKPARELFDRALVLAGTSASDAIHVGDDLQRDVEGARAAGIEPVLIRRNHSGPAPAGVTAIETLTELVDLAF